MAQAVANGVFLVGSRATLARPENTVAKTAMQGNDAIRQRVRALRVEHQDLNDFIDRLSVRGYVDQLQLRRMKKRKLLLKDTITRYESMLIPDLDA